MDCPNGCKSELKQYGAYGFWSCDTCYSIFHEPQPEHSVKDQLKFDDAEGCGFGVSYGTFEIKPHDLARMKRKYKEQGV